MRAKVEIATFSAEDLVVELAGAALEEVLDAAVTPEVLDPAIDIDIDVERVAVF